MEWMFFLTKKGIQERESHVREQLTCPLSSTSIHNKMEAFFGKVHCLSYICDPRQRKGHIR